MHAKLDHAHTEFAPPVRMGVCTAVGRLAATNTAYSNNSSTTAGKNLDILNLNYSQG